MERPLTAVPWLRVMGESKTDAPHSWMARPLLVPFCRWKVTVPGGGERGGGSGGGDEGEGYEAGVCRVS